MSAAVVVSGLGKAYRRYAKPRHRLLEWMAAGRLCRHEVFWALKDLTFSVPGGQCVGVVGLNGAGKSTLLKILTGTTVPTTGSAQLHGRVAALLELGLGFHPEFTGRQNAVMAARLMGISPAEIAALMPSIEAFAEIGAYFDQPLRVYSTGMGVRLAFSVATAVRPDVLIVDETLSVGDAYFQHKCTSRIRDYKAAGTTILLVSHDPATVKVLCDRCLLLDRGRLIQDGPPDRVLDYYHALIATRGASAEIMQDEAAPGETATRSGTFEARILEVELLDARRRPIRAFTVGERARVRCRVAFISAVTAPTVGILIRDRLGSDVFGTNTYFVAPIEATYRRGDELDVEFEVELNVGVGSYTLTVAVHSHATHLLENYDWWDRVLSFKVLPGSQPSFIGTAYLPVRVVRVSPAGAPLDRTPERQPRE